MEIVRAFINGILFIGRFIGTSWFWLLIIPFFIWSVGLEFSEANSEFMDDERKII